MLAGIELEILHGQNVGDAAKASGVQHVVYGSAGTGAADTGVGSWDSKLTVQAHLRAPGVPLTVLRPVAFMELMTDKGFFPAVSTWSLMPKLMGANKPVWWICVDDLAATAARVFAEPDRLVGADLSLAAGIRPISECRDIWRKITGRAPRRLPMPVWMFNRFVGTDLTTMWRWLRTGHIDVDPAQTRELLSTALTVGNGSSGGTHRRRSRLPNRCLGHPDRGDALSCRDEAAN
jgi:uncharacterized protein YbjT (DUF2867 family)